MAGRPSKKKMIIKCCEAAGTYQPKVDPIIDLLADILYRLDKCKKEWKAEGEQFVTTEVNTKGEPYTKKNSKIDIMNKLEDSALRYFNALGITPKSLDEVNGKTASGQCSINDLMQKAIAKAHE